MNEEVIKIEDIVNVLAKRWKLIAIITLVSTLISAVVSFYVIAPKYQSSTKLFIGKESSQSQDKDYDNNDVQMYQKLLKTYAQVITTNDLAQKAIDKGNLDISSKQILGGLTVTPTTDTQILQITYISTNSQLAEEVVESITNQFIKEAGKLIPNGNVKVVESVQVSENPISPNKKLNITVAFLLGLIVGVGISFLLEFIDKTLKTKEQLEETLGLPVVGIIPDERI